MLNSKRSTMNSLIKVILSIFIFVNVICFTVIAQTNVSGGIYLDTTWTLSNSPYVIIDTVVVFPNVTLTIEPGVVVKFENNKRIELRQARLIAEGTINDSITFTSNSPLPTSGIWGEILLNGGNFQGWLNAKFNYCNFKYAHYGIYYDVLSYQGTYDTLTINNSSFEYNVYGFHQNQITLINKIDTSNFIYNTYAGIRLATNSNINSCNVSYNNIGITMFTNGSNIINNCTILYNTNEGIGMSATISGTADSIINCRIKFNGIGISTHYYIYPTIISRNVIENDSIGILLNNSVDNIYCNKICNNTSYNLYYSVTGGNVNIPNNYWCTSDFAQISSGIYDGYDNINLGLVNYQPIDTMQCYLTTSIEGNEVQPFNLIILPNPAFNYLIIVAPYRAFDAILKIYNLLGKLEYSSRIIGQKSYIDISTLSSGIHILEIADGNNGSRQKFIKLQNIR